MADANCEWCGRELPDGERICLRCVMSGCHDAVLARVLRKFVERNRDDHGYVSTETGETKWSLVLDGDVELTEDEWRVVDLLVRGA